MGHFKGYFEEAQYLFDIKIFIFLFLRRGEKLTSVYTSVSARRQTLLDESGTGFMSGLF
jgi:hypothetical protein